MIILNNIWTMIEFVSFFVLIFVFFLDPIRRWNFFGYRPTAVIGMFDADTEKVLLSKVNDVWSFNQGGIYEENIYLTVNEILRRELALPEYCFRLMCTKPLGVIRIHERRLITRPRITSISLFSDIRGKGYLACFALADLKSIEPQIHKGAGVQEFTVVSLAEAEKLIVGSSNAEHVPQKQQMILGMFQEIRQLIAMQKTNA